MKCPYCTIINNKVIDSRLSKDGSMIRRRRECLDCGRRFTTYEKLEDVLPMVVKKDGRREQGNDGGGGRFSYEALIADGAWRRFAAHPTVWCGSKVLLEPAPRRIRARPVCSV